MPKGDLEPSRSSETRGNQIRLHKGFDATKPSSSDYYRYSPNSIKDFRTSPWHITFLSFDLNG